MAKTLGNFIGFETQGYEEASGGSGGTVQNTTARNSGYALRPNGAGNDYLINPFEIGSDAGNYHIVGFWFRVGSETITAGTDRWIIEAEEGAAAHVMGLTLFRESGPGNLLLRIRDANYGATNGTTDIQLNTWYFIEMAWQELNPGNCYVYLDGASEVSRTGQDFLQAGNFDEYRIQGENNFDFYIDNVYCYSGAAGVSDFLGDCEIYAHVVDETTATPDFDGVATADTPTAATGGTGTPTGRWDETDDYLTSTYIIYGGGKGGGADGIALNASITEDPTAVKGIWEMQSTTGDTTTTQYGVIGNSGDGVVNAGAFALTATWDTYFYGSDSATVKPLASEDLRLGVEVKE